MEVFLLGFLLVIDISSALATNIVVLPEKRERKFSI